MNSVGLESRLAVVQGRLINWGLWASRADEPALGPGVQGWQRLLRAKRGALRSVDDFDAQILERCLVYMRYYEPRLAFVLKVFYCDNARKDWQPQDMASDCARRFGVRVGVSTFYRWKDEAEARLGRLLGVVDDCVGMK